MTPEQAFAVADALTDPTAPGLPADHAWWPQSLAHGALGVALLHTELAAAGARPWQRAHDWLSAATRSTVTAGPSSGLFYGAPALAYSLTAVAAVKPGAYRRALETLDARIVVDVRRRIHLANARMSLGRLPVTAEFDLIRGLAGLGAYLLRRDRERDCLRTLLDYLVRLTRAIEDNDMPLPGWWTLTGPTGRPDIEFPGGHGNAGMAHGIGGVLALLALAARRGVTVPGQIEAIEAICAWLDFWQQATAAGICWPYMVTRAETEQRPAHVRHSGARRRPSWCYGTGGLARTLQLAGMALSDADRRRTAEEALAGALTDPAQRALTTDGSLCHGHAGLATIAARASADSDEPHATTLRTLAAELLATAQPPQPRQSPGVLEGAAGIALAATASLTGATTMTDWDACLLIT